MTKKLKKELKAVKPDWLAPSHVQAFSTTRKGGCSLPPFDALNLGDHVGDSSESVAENRGFLSSGLNIPSEPVWLNQQHTTIIQKDQKKYNGEPCDGIYTNQSSVVCAVMTADCMPVLISNKQGSEVAAVHAGWRGLAGGIIEKAISLFESKAKDLLVWAGPTISQQNFEIGLEVKIELGGSERFYEKNPDKAGHYFCDLYGLAGERVTALGASYTYSKQCTYADKKDYFSYRRDGKTGRMASLIWF